MNLLASVPTGFIALIRNFITFVNQEHLIMAFV